MAARRARGVTPAQVCAAGLKLPGVEVSTSYGTTALKVKGKLIARFHEDGEVLVLRTSFEDRAHLMATQPTVFLLRDHYHDYPYVLVQLSALARTQLPELLDDAWRRVAPATLVKKRDAGR